MKKILGSLMLLGCIMLIGCEMPKKPDFTTSHRVEAPIMYNKTYQFMGDSTALIDTTSTDLDSLFTVDGDNFITISKEQDFDFGDLNDAIPEVAVDPTDFQSQVGEIVLENFTSGSDENLGSADIEEVTGNDPDLIAAETPIPGGANPTPIEIGIGASTDYFVSAVIKSGGLNMTITNNLGFDLTTLNVQLKDTVSNTAIGQPAVFSSGVANNATETAQVVFTQGDELANLGVEINVTWDGFNFPNNPGELVVDAIEGDNLIASQVEAAIETQDFSTSSITLFDDSEFQFTDASHYVELQSGDLLINSIQNNIDINVEYMRISFPGIRKAPYTVADSLVIEYSDGEAIPRGGSSAEKNIDLSAYRIYALNNEIQYNISAFTENTQQGSGSSARVIAEVDDIASSVEIHELMVQKAFGNIVSQNVLLSEDDLVNGEDNLDLFNENEVEITEIDGLGELSKQISGLEFTQPTLSINYSTSVGVGTTVYGAFLGIDGNGNEVFLNGKSGSGYEVSATDPVSGMFSNGQQLSTDQLIKFDLETSTNGGLVNGSVVFEESNTNVDDFLNNLPSEIRFIGKAVINEANEEGSINTPVEFDPRISVDLPLAFKTTEAATFTDTTEQTFDLPSSDKDDNYSISEGRIIIEYTNGLPLGINLSFGFIDSLDNKFVSLPLQDEVIKLDAAAVDEITKFAKTPTSGSLVVALNKEQLDQLYKTKFMEVKAELVTTNNSEVRLKTTDSIQLSIRADLSIESDINDLFEGTSRR